MNRIQVNARFTDISRSNLAEFRKAAAQAMEIAKSEPGVVPGLTGGCELEMFGEPSAQVVDVTALLQRSIYRSSFQSK
jgi:hypothetical protein